MNGDLISRSALTEAFNRYGDCDWHISAIETEIEAAPAVDAVEVVHGRWEFIKNKYCETAACSVCGTAQGLYINGRTPNWNYCPNCGAKMDGERKDNE